MSIVCNTIITIIVLLFVLKSMYIIKPKCNTSILNIFTSNFYHADLFHLISNIFGLFVLTRLETKIGLKKFLTILILLLIINTFIENYLITKHNLNCSVGFSAIIYSLLSWEIFSGHRHLDMYILGAVFFDILGVFSKNTSNIAFVNHLMGLISGGFLAQFIHFT